MAFYLDGPTSLALLRLARNRRGDSRIPVTCRKVSLPDGWRPAPAGRLTDAAVPSDAETERLLGRELAGLTPPLGFFVAHDGARRTSALRYTRLCSVALPDGALVETIPGIFSCSPEFSLLQLAARKGSVEAARAAYELCGVFSLPISVGGERDLVRTPPCTSAARIAGFCKRATGLSGVKPIRGILPYVLDGAASPREADLALLLFLPRSHGGYGLRPGVLNMPFSTGRRARRVRGGNEPYIPDIQWPGCNVTVDYDGRDYHAGPVHTARDLRRRNAFASEAVGAITVTNAQLRSVGDMDELARRLALRLGAPVRRRDWSPAWRERQERLRAQLGLPTDRSDFDGWEPVAESPRGNPAG